MTMLDTLFGLIPAASRGQQWLAEDLQLINWGGYDGAHRVRFSPTATLLCGGSGSGKSTLMDAYVALMMPHTTPFNGASNGAVVGRPRGQEQRNILSYGRGKIDESRTDDGTKVRVLRGDGADTWTAVSMTWVDHDGSRFTAVRAWYLPAGARVLEDTVRVRATVHGAFDLGALEGAAAERLTDASVRAAGLETVATDREFSARLHAVLGIGAAGAGSKAMSLLARIQAGQQITTVDDLYKRMVLEEPESIATADAVVAHFDELESTRVRMLVAQQQVRTLRPIRDIRARIDEAVDRLAVIEDVGRFAAADSIAALWRAERRLDLLRRVEAELGARAHAAERALREQHALADAAELERDGLADLLRAAGGDRLETAQRELRALDRRQIEVQRDRARLDAALDALGATVTTRAQFAEVVDRARRALDDRDAKATAREAYAAAAGTRTAVRADLARVERERAAAEAHRDSIPARLHESRAMLARAAGLASEDLPFVGELVEVRTEFEPWREAFNLALGGFARTLLIDAADLPAFRAAIDTVRTPERLHYEGVHTDLPRVAELDPRTLPGRLEFADGPFAGWLQDRLDRHYGFVCVDQAGELDEHRMALTIAGQTATGGRGAHGGHGRSNLLGFSNRSRLAELDERLDALRAELAAAEAAVEVAAAELDGIDARRAASEKVLDLTWEQVDLDTIAAERARWAGIIDEITAGNPKIAGLQEQIATAKRTVARLREAVGSARSEHDRLTRSWAAITDEVDAAQLTIDAAETAGRALTAEQAAYLDARLLHSAADDQATADLELARFDAAVDSAAKQLADDQRAAIETVAEQRVLLTRTLEAFLERWPNPNLLADPEHSFADFERILVDLETSGLHELETEWRDSLLTLSGNDLTNLDSTLSRSLREIEDRIEPINVILQDLAFYDDGSRLQITPRQSQSETRRRFRRELRDVRALIDAAATDADREQVYHRMSRLIARIRRSAPEFADLVDVRNHVRVSAERVDATTRRHIALYDHIGEKSGGESQELIAFIVGAALRYQLGDAGAPRPRYAPVFLDEALIKADAHFTKRAIGAWRGLGFQLVIGAPNDKYSAIEPHVDVEYDILKDTRGRSWAKPKVAVPTPA